MKLFSDYEPIRVEPEHQLIQWLTGRHYDEHGQRLVLQMNKNEILFSDLSRHINGSVPLGSYFHAHRREDTWVLKEIVMRNYDLGNYGYSRLTLPWDDLAPIATINAV